MLKTKSCHDIKGFIRLKSKGHIPYTGLITFYIKWKNNQVYHIANVLAETF